MYCTGDVSSSNEYHSGIQTQVTTCCHFLEGSKYDLILFKWDILRNDVKITWFSLENWWKLYSNNSRVPEVTLRYIHHLSDESKIRRESHWHLLIRPFLFTLLRLSPLFSPAVVFSLSFLYYLPQSSMFLSFYSSISFFCSLPVVAI